MLSMQARFTCGAIGLQGFFQEPYHSIGLYQIFTARSSYASVVFGIVILPARLSIIRVLCDETKEHS